MGCLGEVTSLFYFDSKSMTQKIHLIILLLTLFALGAYAQAISPDKYASLLLGKWEIRTYGYEFRPDGGCQMINPDDGTVLKSGKWSIAAQNLSLKWNDEPSQLWTLKFLTPDLWEWESAPGRVWEATRLGSVPESQESTPLEPTADDAKNCEFYTRAILKNEDRNESTLNSCYAPDFRKLILLGIASTDDDPLPYLNYDFVYETQDTNPKVLKIGPAAIRGAQINVPVVMQQGKNRPFTKTWIFVRIKDRWMVSDILTSGHEFSDGSLAAKLAKQFSK